MSVRQDYPILGKVTMAPFCFTVQTSGIGWAMKYPVDGEQFSTVSVAGKFPFPKVSDPSNAIKDEPLTWEPKVTFRRVRNVGPSFTPASHQR